MLILASASPRRKNLLSYLISDFKILTADLDEDKFLPLARTPEEFVTKLSLAKAKKVISTINTVSFPSRPASAVTTSGIQKNQIPYPAKNKPIGNDNIIISADTIVVLPKEESFQVIGKPKDKKDAQITLKNLRGKTHQVYTGFTVIDQKTNQIFTDFSVSNVTFKLFSDKQLLDYLEKFEPYDKAGAYAIQEMGSKYIEKYDGSLTGIIGLPLEQLGQTLENFKIELKPNWQENIKKQVTFK